MKKPYSRTYNLHANLQRKIYIDQTEKFSVTSYCGDHYIMVLVELNGTVIMVKKTKKRNL